MHNLSPYTASCSILMSTLPQSNSDGIELCILGIQNTRTKLPGNGLQTPMLLVTKAAAKNVKLCW